MRFTTTICDVCGRTIHGDPGAKKVDSSGRCYDLCQTCVNNEWVLLEGQEVVNGKQRRTILPILRNNIGAYHNRV
jgi:hypothetical protein